MSVPALFDEHQTQIFQIFLRNRLSFAQRVRNGNGYKNTFIVQISCLTIFFKRPSFVIDSGHHVDVFSEIFKNILRIFGGILKGDQLYL